MMSAIPNTLQLHITYSAKESESDIARRTLTALRLVCPNWFIEDHDDPVLRSNLLTG